MLGLGPIGFFAPWALLGLLVLPVVWWLVRFLPPSPRHVLFPATRFLMNASRDQPRQRSSVWWVLMLRILAVSALVLASAEPVFRPEASFGASGPVIIAIDDGWASATDWNERRDVADKLISRAERENRAVMVLATALDAAGRNSAPTLMTAAEAHRLIDGLQPKPWPSDASRAFAALTGPAAPLTKAARVYWLSDGFAPSANKIAPTQIERMMRIGPLTVYRPGMHAGALLLRAEKDAGASLIARVSRGQTGEAVSQTVIAYDETGVAVGRASAVFGKNDPVAKAVFDLPIELRNRIVRLGIDGRHSAGSVALLDDRWQRRTVGLIAAGGLGNEQPLLSGEHYLSEAMGENHEIRVGDLNDLLDDGVPVIVSDDPGMLNPTDTTRLKTWVESGGVLIVFAGPRFAEATLGKPGAVGEPVAGWPTLLPVILRQGDRAIGGAMSWRQPATIAPFDAQSPFAGLGVSDDIRVKRQVLAEPDVDIDQRSWAKLSDGTPLVTGRNMGQGWSVLFHVTANAEWSNLPISGLFVEMLNRLTALSNKTSAVSGDRILAPYETLDGFGALHDAPTGASAIAASVLGTTVASPDHPPGYYGDGDDHRALNLSDGLRALTPLGPMPDGVEMRSYVATSEQPIAPWLVSLAFLLLLADLAAALWMRGYFEWFSGMPATRAKAARFTVISAFALCLLWPSTASAAETGITTAMIEAAANTRLAYIETGDRRTDQITRLGLVGLGRILHQRTAVELAAPVAVDPAHDELALYPLIYWPVTATSSVPSNAEARRIDGYLTHGGMILFDAKSTQPIVVNIATRIVEALDVPHLRPVPKNHVLGRSFYLLSDFPGRWTGRPVWIAPADDRINDGVAPIIAGSNDWTGAWATDEFQKPLFPCVPGGERQRELAFRFGVNVVMYALTGNYKADQVHIPTIMQRLGQ